MIQTFTIQGPPKPQGRPRLGRRSVYDPTQKYKRDAALQVMSQGPKLIEKGPIRVFIAFVMPKPKRLGKNAFWHTKRGDIDNLIKAVLDALNGIVWTDDSQVCHIEALKRYGGNPRTKIDVEVIE